MITCARKDCVTEFYRKTHNQKYCSSECCRVATNQRIMEKYYERRDQRQGKVRYCKICGITKLSRYNNDTKCNSCKAKDKMEFNRELSSMLLAIDWQS